MLIHCSRWSPAGWLAALSRHSLARSLYRPRVISQFSGKRNLRILYVYGAMPTDPDQIATDSEPSLPALRSLAMDIRELRAKSLHHGALPSWLAIKR